VADAGGATRRATGASSGRSSRARGTGAGRTAAATGQAARAATGRQAPSQTARDASSDTAQDGVCPVAFCPICTAVSVVNRASPDVVQHLLLAGQQFLMALKAVVDARASDFDEPEDGDRPFERVDIG